MRCYVIHIIIKKKFYIINFEPSFVKKNVIYNLKHPYLDFILILL